ncbi:MAG: hypothetical protein M1814_001078 [Vezdaea aestivalis]|nr:MAG: hypothetical protein M1814_001078 [Vezdaea aestivalis]
MLLRPRQQIQICRGFPNAVGRRRFFSEQRAVAWSHVENVEVAIGSNGFVPLSIRHAINPSPELTKVILHFPRGPFNASAASAAFESSLLAASRSSTIVTVGYRYTGDHRFPTPIHDAAAGYDWVVRNIVDSDRPSSSVQITACGELLGGSLAGMLALTESHRHKIGISNLLLLNPVLDWTFPDAADVVSDFRTSKKRPKAQAQPSWRLDSKAFPQSPTQLLEARLSLFRNRGQYFDPFASPALFFRTPRVEYYSVHELQQQDQSRIEMESVNHSQKSITGLNVSSTDASTVESNCGTGSLKVENKDDPEPQAVPRNFKALFVQKRGYNLLFPPTKSLLRLPRTLIAQSQNSPLLDQGNEFVRLMRRSIIANEFGVKRLQGSGLIRRDEELDEEETESQLAQTVRDMEDEKYATKRSEERIVSVMVGSGMPEKNEHSIDTFLAENTMPRGTTQ